MPSHLSYCEWSCYEHRSANVSEILSSISLAIAPELLSLNGSSFSYFLRNVYVVFHNFCTLLHSHQLCSNFSTLLPILVVFSFIYLTICHSDRSDVISH